MRLVGAHLGSVVEVTVTTHSGAKRTEPFRVVSQNSFPQYGGFVSLGTGVLLTTADLVRIACLPGSHAGPVPTKDRRMQTGGVRVSFASGPRGKAAMDHYVAAYSPIVSKPLAPTSLVNFGEAVNFPLIFGAMLAIFGAATLAHLLVVSVARRRREVGLLKVLGFVNRQVVSTVAWQATTLALVGIVVGVPLGVIWPGGLERLRQQPWGRPDHGDAGPARGRNHCGGPRGRQRDSRRAGMGSDAIEGGGPPATSRLKVARTPSGVPVLCGPQLGRRTEGVTWDHGCRRTASKTSHLRQPVPRGEALLIDTRKLQIFFSHESKADRFCQSNAGRRIASSRRCHHCDRLAGLFRLGSAHRTIRDHGQWRDMDATSEQVRKYLSFPRGRRTRVAPYDRPVGLLNRRIGRWERRT